MNIRIKMTGFQRFRTAVAVILMAVGAAAVPVAAHDAPRHAAAPVAVAGNTGVTTPAVQSAKIPVQRFDLSTEGRVELVPGHIWRKSIGAEALGVTVFWMRPSDDPARELIPKHKHGEEMFYVISGKGTINIEGKPYAIKAGDTLLIPAGAEHHGVIESEELVILCVENPPRPGLRFYFNDVTKDGAPLIPAPSASEK